MKKHLAIIRLLLSATLLWVCGCHRPGRDTDFYTLSVPPEKVQTVESFEPEPFRTEPQPVVPSVLEFPEEPPQQIDLGLEQCRALALENNLDLKVQLLEPTIAQEQVNAERAKFEASFFSNINYYKIDQPASANLAIQSSQGETANVEMGVEVPLQTGGTITFDLADTRNISNFQSSTFNPSYENDFSVSISQPLLQGAGVRSNMHSIRIAEYDKQIIDARTKLEVISVISAMDRVYWRLYAAYKLLEVRKQQHELARSQLQRAQRFVSAGEQAQIEINRAEAGLAQSLESIILAHNDLLDRQRELKRTINKSGLELQGPTAIVPATEPNPVHYTFHTKQLVDQAVDNRMEMLELELQIAKNISSIDYLRNQALPLVTMNYTYNINGLGPTRSDSYDLLQDNNFTDHILGLKLVVPLGNKAAESNLRAAYHTRIQSLASKENRHKFIEVEVLDALDQLESNWQRILAARQNTILQERLYQAEIRYFENGMSTSTDVLIAQTDFADAQSTEINALAEYQIALVDLAYATGTLLGAAQVEWEPIVPAIP